MPIDYTKGDSGTFTRKQQKALKPMTFKQCKAHLDTVSLTEALWWFIENMSEDHPARSDAFFYLRERVRKGE